MGKAVGIIEVYGLAAAFVACDAGCKAAINSQTEYCLEEAVDSEEE